MSSSYRHIAYPSNSQERKTWMNSWMWVWMHKDLHISVGLEIFCRNVRHVWYMFNDIELLICLRIQDHILLKNYMKKHIISNITGRKFFLKMYYNSTIWWRNRQMLQLICKWAQHCHLWPVVWGRKLEVIF